MVVDIRSRNFHCIAYAYLLLINEEPAICSIDQYSMRRLYNRFVTKDLLYMMFGYEQVDKKITGNTKHLKYF